MVHTFYNCVSEQFHNFLFKYNYFRQLLILKKMTKVYGQTSLPKNFADQLLNCEIEIELNEIIPKETIMQVLELYSKGMEYFESIRSYKYMYFQRRMNTIMRSPKIINSMSNPQAHKNQSTKTTNSRGENSISLNQQEKVKIMQVKHKYQKMYNDYIGETSALTGDKIKKIVAENQHKLNQVKESIKDQISQQERRLQLKIQRRKFQKATKKSMSAAELQKSTRDSLFNQSQQCSFDQHESIDVDFSKVINQHEYDSNDQKEDEDRKKKTQLKQKCHSESKQKIEVTPEKSAHHDLQQKQKIMSKTEQKAS